MGYGRKIPTSEMQPGDAVYFSTHPENDGKSDHVGIFVGNGQIIHAPRTGEQVKYGQLSGRKIVTVRRFF